MGLERTLAEHRGPPYRLLPTSAVHTRRFLFLPTNFWGMELFRFATLLASLSSTRALSLPISALMCLASTLAGLEKA